MADIPELYRLNYNIETPEAEAFWASRHKANRAKAIMAFSLDLDNANDNYRRWNYPRQFRKRALLNFCMYVNKPDMKGIPLSPLDSPWWIEMPYREDSACNGGGGNSAAPVITTQPKGSTITVGQTFSMSVVATGSGTLTYQWQENQGGNWVNITHTEPSWTSTPAAKATTRTFRVRVTNTESGKTPTTITSSEAVVKINAAAVDITSMSTATDLMGVYDTTVDVKNIPLPFHVEPANATVASVKYSMSGSDVTVRGITVDENTGIVTVPAKQVNGDEQTGDNFSVTVTVVDGNGHSFSDTSDYHTYDFDRYVTEGVSSQVVTVGQDYTFQYKEDQKNRWGYSFNNEAGSPLHFEDTLGAATIEVESDDLTSLTVKSVDKFNVVVHGVADGNAHVITKYTYGGAAGQDSTYISVNDPAKHTTT